MITGITDRYEWVVNARYLNQQHSVKLYRLKGQLDGLMKDNNYINDRKWHKVFHLLLGANFSLWRAAPLIKTDARSMDEVDKNAFDFLEKLIEDNAINYTQDKAMSSWSEGYYLNNARYRLLRAKNRLIESKCECDITESFVSDDRDQKPRKHWDDLMQYSEKLLDCLIKQLSLPAVDGL